MLLFLKDSGNRNVNLKKINVSDTPLKVLFPSQHKVLLSLDSFLQLKLIYLMYLLINDDDRMFESL